MLTQTQLNAINDKRRLQGRPALSMADARRYESQRREAVQSSGNNDVMDFLVAYTTGVPFNLSPAAIIGAATSPAWDIPSSSPSRSDDSSSYSSSSSSDSGSSSYDSGSSSSSSFD